MKRQPVMALIGLILFAVSLGAVGDSKTDLRIVTLSPHLTEWVYVLDMQSHLVAVSAYSDFPAEAQALPVVADANGVAFRALLLSQPTIVLAWEGGNKPQDISRIESAGLHVFRSSPKNLSDIADEIRQLSNVLNVPARGNAIAMEFESTLANIHQTYQREQRLPVFYYLWTSPLMTIGANAWGNQALNACGAQTLYADSPTDYPEVRLADVLVRKPRALVTTISGSHDELMTFWSPHKPHINVPIISVDADVMHRFSPRILTEIEKMCRQLHTIN